MITYVFYGGLLVFGLLALGWVRRHAYEVFYYSHHYALVMYVGALWPPPQQYYVLPSVLLYIVDRLLRFHAATREVRLVCIAPKADVTELHFVMPRGASTTRRVGTSSSTSPRSRRSGGIRSRSRRARSMARRHST